MKREWTPMQLDAINARGGSVLVSAAAGSGKTAVLVERVIERITDKENPCDVNRLLIVTFTRAAAGEMRQRIADAVSDCIKKAPADQNLIRQQMLLPSAKICTIDSFCSSFVRDNFQSLDISPDFKIGDSGELNLLKAKAMEDTLEELYGEKSSDFINLVELLFKNRDDRNLAEMIYQLYEASMPYPFPEKWLDEISSKYQGGVGIGESVYGRVILGYVNDALEYCLYIIASMKKIFEGVDHLEKAYRTAVISDEEYIRKLLEPVKSGKWDEARALLLSYKPVSKGRIDKQYKGCPEDLSLDACRNDIKKIIRENIGDVMCCSAAEYENDMAYLEPMVRKLCYATKLFSENFKKAKYEKNTADFTDVMHFALSLLVKSTDDGFERTPLAVETAENYDEILIDEYQDTNKAQDMLFTAISENNLFRVGDVKQSIYRFRRAMPEIFIELKNSYQTYSKEKDNYPSKIILGNNFRSRKSVTGAVNFVFSQLMSDRVGDVSYGDEEELVFSAKYYNEKNDEATQLHLLDVAGLDKEEESKESFQARYVAEMINSMTESGFTVSDSNGERPVRYGDFCILLRSANGENGLVYADELRKRKIPCFTEIKVDFFDTYEVELVLSLLRVIDNPKQDIPLLTVLMSVLFGFTADELARLRINDRKSDIYGCLLSSKENVKVKDFLDKISQWRLLSISMGVEEFIRMIYEQTALTVIVGAMKNSAAKTANLRLLLDYAVTYEKMGYMGLSDFIGFIDHLEREKQDLTGSAGVSADADVVKIMSIHKSKGLEFPVCIVANCGKLFNREDEKRNMVISSKEGIGIVLRDTETLAQYPTVSHKAVKLSIRNDSVSEEMRVLYVAMTRAREKLIMVGAVNDLEKKIVKYAVNINAEKSTAAPFAVSRATSYAEWLITAFLRHKDAGVLRNMAGLDESIVLKSDFPLEVKVTHWNAGETEEAEEKINACVDRELLRLIEERAAYKYKYEPLTYVISKRAASEVDKTCVDRDYFASSRPAFLSENGLTAAQKGTATHAFMQFADYEKAKLSVKAEIERLCEKGFISATEAAAINVRAVERFFKSNLAERILSSSIVMREKKFTISVPVGDIYPELSSFTDERVVIQGIADCAFVENGRLTVVDYKTDGLESEKAFIEKYAEQVKMYKKALTLCTGYEVEKTLLYSFRLGREIEVEA